MPRARFDDRRVRGLAGHDRRGRMALIGLSLAFACATSKGAPIQSGPAPENPERAASTLANQESVELVDPEPAAIEPMLVGDPAPWLEDADLRERILAVQPIVEAAAAARELDPALITPEGAHRLLGVLLYVPVLLGLCQLADRWVNRAALTRLTSLLVPYLIYLGVTLLLPLIHHAAGGRPDGFFHHAAVTISVGTAVLLGFALLSGRSDVRSRSDGSA